MPSSAVATSRSSATSQSAPTPRQSHWKRPVTARIGRGEVGRLLALVLPVGEQDRVPLRGARHGVEQLAGQAQPGADRRAAVRHEPRHRLLGGGPGAGLHPDHRHRRVRVRERPRRDVGARDDREPGAVEDLVDGDRGRRPAPRGSCRPSSSPDVSTMMISAASPPPARPASPAPVAVTDTTACTSVAPSDRNSFWNTSALNSAWWSAFHSLFAVSTSRVTWWSPAGARGRARR